MPPSQKIQRRTNYIHVSSYHPPSIIQEISQSIENRLSILISSKKYFSGVCHFLWKCLNNSGYKNKLQYQQPKENNQNKKKRKCNILWFNPPHSKSVKANIGRTLIKFISKHFLPSHKFVKMFNKNTIKVSYLYMPNIRSKKLSQQKNTKTKAHRATKIMQLPY